MTPFEAVLCRVVFAHRAAHLLDAAPGPEGRFHHDGQPAIYLSPTLADTRVAMRAYLRDDDPPRVMAQIAVSAARVLDLRQPQVLARLGLQGGESLVSWRPQRAAGLPATSWTVSDRARDLDTDGMIYPSDRAPSGWHLVLFRWNAPDAARLALIGAPQPWTAA